MGMIDTILRTRSFPWKVVRTGIITGTAPTFDLSKMSCGGWANRAAFSPLNLDAREIFYGRTPNAIAICPWVAPITCGLSMANRVARFRVDGYRGQNNNLDRLAAVSAKVGQYTFSADDNGNAVVLKSGHYCDTLVLENNYNHSSVKLIDAAGDNGRGYLVFDNIGQPLLTINLVSTLLTNMSLNFAITGW